MPHPGQAVPGGAQFQGIDYVVAQVRRNRSGRGEVPCDSGAELGGGAAIPPGSRKAFREGPGTRCLEYVDLLSICGTLRGHAVVLARGSSVPKNSRDRPRAQQSDGPPAAARSQATGGRQKTAGICLAAIPPQALTETGGSGNAPAIFSHLVFPFRSQ